MDRQLAEWKGAVERFWSAASPDWLAAAKLAAEIASRGTDETLRQAAGQALPSLRRAALKGADRGIKEMARRRLGPVRDALHQLTAPRFGRRGVIERPLTPEEHYRQVLGLPLGRRLSGAEIRQAYKQAAKSVHPDVGGDGRAFHELTAARDALLHPESQRAE